MAGVNLNTIRELLGHKSIEMTLRYSHLSSDHKRRAVEIFDKRWTPQWTPSTSEKKTADLDISQLLESKIDI